MYYNIAEQIKGGMIYPVYVFHGANRYFIEASVRLLREEVCGKDEFNFEKISAETVTPAELVMMASSQSFFAEKRLMVVDNVSWFGKTSGEGGDLEPLLSYLASPSPDIVLVFIATNTPMKTKKLVKAAAAVGLVAEFTALSGAGASSAVKSLFASYGKKIDVKAINQLLLFCDNDFLLIEQEARKLVCYVGTRAEINETDVNLLVTKNTTVKVFSLVDAVASGNLARSLEMCDELLKEEAPQKLLTLLANQFHLIIFVSDLYAAGATLAKIMEEKGENRSFIIEKALRQGGNFTEQGKKKAMQLLMEADYNSKQGISDAENALREAIIGICSLK